MTPDQKKLARHALGLETEIRGRRPESFNGRSYRNRYVVYGNASEAYHHWREMMEVGYATMTRRWAGHDWQHWFSLTRKGAEAAIFPNERLCPEDFPQ